MAKFATSAGGLIIRAAGNPNHISFDDIGFGLIPIFAGIVLTFLAYWVARIRR
jgi:hypothetical protein